MFSIKIWIGLHQITTTQKPRQMNRGELLRISDLISTLISRYYAFLTYFDIFFSDFFRFVLELNAIQVSELFT